jgi:hypothetical protein
MKKVVSLVLAFLLLGATVAFARMSQGCETGCAPGGPLPKPCIMCMWDK